MPVNSIISIDDARLLVWEVTESIDELKLHLQNFDENEFGTIASEKRKLEFLGVRVALKELLGEEIQISYTENRKPYLKNNRYEISVSHSGKWIAVMAHRNQQNGIDIEIPTDKIQKVFTRFLSETEQQELSNGQSIKQLQIAWSAKEALYKIIGKEAVDFATQLQIFPFELKSKGDLLAKHIATNNIYKLQYIQNSAYTLVYCLAQ